MSKTNPEETHVNYISPDGIRFLITSKITGIIAGDPWGGKSWDRKPTNEHHVKFRITIKNMDSSARAVSFPFYDSIANYQKGVFELTSGSILSAFLAIIGDGSYGGMSKEDICDEFGYDCFEQKAIVTRVHKGLQSAREKLESIGVSEDDMYAILNDPELEPYR